MIDRHPPDSLQPEAIGHAGQLCGRNGTDGGYPALHMRHEAAESGPPAALRLLRKEEVMA